MQILLLSRKNRKSPSFLIHAISVFAVRCCRHHQEGGYGDNNKVLLYGAAAVEAIFLFSRQYRIGMLN
jgi:hypothetical protein